MIGGIIAVPLDLAVRKMVHEATTELYLELMAELREWDRDLYEYCTTSVDCKLQLIRISIDVAAIIIRELLEEAVRDEWEAALEAYNAVTRGSTYHT